MTMKIREEFAKATTAEEVKAIYKKLAMKYHPDRGGDVEIMKAVNSLYDEYFERLKHVHKTKDGKTYEKATTETPAEFKDIIDKLFYDRGMVTFREAINMIAENMTAAENEIALKAE